MTKNVRAAKFTKHKNDQRNIQHVCNFNDVITPHPTHPPQPHVLRSIQHVCNFNDVFTPHPTHPPQPHVLRSIQHVCNFNDVFTPHPTHPPNPTHVTGVKENAWIPPFTVGEARSETRRYVRLEPTTNAMETRKRKQNKTINLAWKPLVNQHSHGKSPNLTAFTAKKW